MEPRFELIGAGEAAVCLVNGAGLLVHSAQDMLDLIATLNYQHGCSRLVLKKEQLAPDFFDLRTGLAGEVLQKVTNYHAALAIVGDFSAVGSKALRDFITESNRGTRVFFVPDTETATQKLRHQAVL